MNQQAVRRLLSAAWEPKSHDIETLVHDFGMSRGEGLQIIRDVNAGQVEPVDFVTHHDLVAYLRDLTSIAVIPEHREEISTHGHWLIEKGWSIDLQRSKFRWIDPSEPSRRMTLSNALFRQMLRERTVAVEGPNDVIDAEFVVRTPSPLGRTSASP